MRSTHYKCTFPTADRSSELGGSSVNPLNFLGTLSLLADDTEFYFTEIFETIRQELFQLPLLSPTFFPPVSFLYLLF